MTQRHIRIDGLVVDSSSRRPLPGLRVEAWDEDLAVDDFVGRVEQTGPDGRFSIALEDSYFRGLFRERHPDLYFRVFRNDALIARTPTLVRALGKERGAEGTAVVEVEIAIDHPGSVAPRAPAHLEVSGCVRRAGGCCPPPARVRAFEATPAGRVLLGEALTDPIGRFAIAYDPRRRPQPPATPMQLVLQAVDVDDTVMGTASAAVAPRPDETVDIVIAAARRPEGEGPGRVIDGCRIDLPADDVVEQIDFERFYRLNLSYGDLMPKPPTTRSATGDQDRPDEGPNPLDVRTLPLALYLPFVQSWKLEGYTRGRLVKSFALGPGEEQTVEVFSWDRLRSSLESTTSLEQEQNTESAGTRRDTLDVARDVGQQTGFEMTTGGKVGFQVGVVRVDMDASTSGRHASTQAEKETRSAIVEATTRATQRVRTSRTLKVTESRESGSEERITRKLRNPNAAHTLTVAFFEILSNYQVITRLQAGRAQLVVLIPSADLAGVARFDRRAVRTHERALRLALLDATLAPGFDAARLLDARDRACGVLCQGCSCGETSTDTGSPEWTALLADGPAVARALSTVAARRLVFPLSIVPAEAGSAWAVADILCYLFGQALRRYAPRLLADLAGLGLDAQTGATAAQVHALRAILATLTTETLGKVRSDNAVADGVWSEIRDWILATLPIGDPISFGISYGVACKRADDLKKKCGGFASFDDGGLVGALLAFSGHYDGWAQAQAAARQADEKKAELARIAKEEREVRILETFGLRETAEASERLEALLDHLNQRRNLDHYRFAVWNERSGSSDETIMSMALAGIIDPTPVGIVGETLAVPVRLTPGTPLAELAAQCLAGFQEATPVDTRRHILPTSALHCEAVVGECSAREPESASRERLEIWRVALDNQATALEVRRLQARLDASPPLLDHDGCRSIPLELRVGANTAEAQGADRS